VPSLVRHQFTAIIQNSITNECFPPQAMAKDHENYYQDTPKQIRQKILRFKRSQKNFEEYLEAINE
jgi:hypothetical protein